MTDNRTNEQIAIDALRVCGVTGHVNEDYASAMLEALCAAGRLATRVPVQGEPNDDRKALAERLRRGPLVWNPIYHVWSTVTHDVMPVVDAVIASRATVPDAAEGGGTPYSCSDLGHYDCDGSHESHKPKAVPDAATAAETFRDLGIKHKAQRDAALAAVERVRSIHQKRGASWPHNGGVYVCGADNGMWPCPTLAALDGAPEPEEIAEQDAAVAAMEQDECTLPGHAGCTRVMVDGELWIDHFPSERGADTDGESK